MVFCFSLDLCLYLQVMMFGWQGGLLDGKAGAALVLFHAYAHLIHRDTANRGN